MDRRYYLSEEIQGKKFALVIIYDDKEISQVFYNKNGHFSMKVSFERDADKVNDFIKKPQIGSLKFEEAKVQRIFNDHLIYKSLLLSTRIQKMFH